MKGYYLYEHTGNVPAGIIKKIQKQCSVFEKVSIQCSLLPVLPRGGWIYKILRCFPGGTDNIKWPDLDKIRDAQFLYIRKPVFTIHFLRFTKKVKMRNPAVVIIVEIPTFPYDREYVSTRLLGRALLARDMLARKFIYKSVDYLAVIGKCGEKLWKVPVLHIHNGIDIHEFGVRKPYICDDVIRILCIANFQDYHGIDCFLEGMAQYYQSSGNRKVELHLAGEGKWYETFQEIVKKNACLKGKVFFYGALYGPEKMKLYDKCDLGIVSLAYSRINLKCNTTIKSKEYMAVGLPFIGDTDIDVLAGAKVDYFCRVRYGETPVDMNDIINFYDGLYPDPSPDEKIRLANIIRMDAGEKADMDTALSAVIHALQKNI